MSENIFTKKRLEDAEYEWTGLSTQEVADIRSQFNPLIDRTDIEHENLGLRELYIMSDIDYIYFAVKTLLNIELAPFQMAVLYVLWNKAFPMLIGSRGLSKTFMIAIYCLLRLAMNQGIKIVVTGSGFRQSKLIFEAMMSIWNNSPVIRSIFKGNRDGPKQPVDMWEFRLGASVLYAIPVGATGSTIRGLRANILIVDEFDCLTQDTLIQTEFGLIRLKDYIDGKTGYLLNKNNEFEYPSHICITPKPVDVYKITTACGYSYKCSEDHKIMTTEGWKAAKDLSTEDFLELGVCDYFPEENLKSGDVILNDNIGKLLGALISEGTVTSTNYIEVTSTDINYINKVRDCLPDANWKLYTKEEYKDSRGWNCKKSYSLKLHDTKFRKVLKEFGLDNVTSHNKDIPAGILMSPKSVIIEFLKLLWEGDGSCVVNYNNGKKNVNLVYYSVSEELIKTLQILLLKFNITSSITKRKGKLSKNWQYCLNCRAEQAVKLHTLLQIDKFNKNMQNCSFLRRKPGIREVNGRFILETTRANKNVYLGTFKSKEECLKEFNKYWENCLPSFRIKSIEILDKQEVLYDFHLPKTHSFYGNGFIQHNSMNIEIYETVISGFAAVSMDPVENIKREMRNKRFIEAGGDIADLESNTFKNQSIIAGTMGFSFNPMAQYWKKYKSIIESRGEILKTEENENYSDLSYKDFAIIRIPYELIPRGFMADSVVSRAKASMHTGAYESEYGCVPINDTMGFYKRSLIESCTCKPLSMSDNSWPDFCKQPFDAQVYGNPKLKYIFGIDPAAEEDNFAIVILELHPEHARVVYVWTVNKEKFKKFKHLHNTDEQNYYAYCARKIRDLMRKFPCSAIAMDPQGGGVAIQEALKDKDKIQEGEVAILPFIDPDKEKDTDDLPGNHIIYDCSFASADWVRDANNGLRKDMEDKILLFPQYNAVILGLASEKSYIQNDEAILYDNLEFCMTEIEELKIELSTIVVTKSVGGTREKWDTPDIKVGAKAKSTLKKDRYSALLMANYISRTLNRAIPAPTFNFVGGAVGNIAGEISATNYQGPEWYKESSNIFRGITR